MARHRQRANPDLKFQMNVTTVETSVSSICKRESPPNCKFIRDQIPRGGLFAGMEWKISPTPFPLGENLAKEIESLGRVLLQFYRAINLLYRKSVEGKQPEWVARWLDLGKPRELIELQRSPAFKNEIPRVIRPDILLTENGFSITELDSVPGGIGLTAWLNQTYSKSEIRNPKSEILGGADGMIRGFESIFGERETGSHRRFGRGQNLSAGNGMAGGNNSAIHDSQFTIHNLKILRRATRFIGFSNCLICPMLPMRKRFLNSRRKRKSA